MWILFVLFLPFLGVFVYLISQGQGMAERDMRGAQEAQAQFDDYVRTVAPAGTAAEIEKLKGLLDSGAISQSEYDAAKAKALAS
jgi:membrane protease subunit (stomatin/prohibitin family)